MSRETPLEISYASQAYATPQIADLIRRQAEALAEQGRKILGCHVSVGPSLRPHPGRCHVRVRVEALLAPGYRAAAAAEASGETPEECGGPAVQNAFAAIERQIARR